MATVERKEDLQKAIPHPWTLPPSPPLPTHLQHTTRGERGRREGGNQHIVNLDDEVTMCGLVNAIASLDHVNSLSRVCTKLHYLHCPAHIYRRDLAWGVH